MSEETGTITNWYVTVRTPDDDMECYVNVIHFNGETSVYGQHPYSHLRSARRAAKALALKLDVSYRQDLEYSDNPHAFVAKATV